MKTSELKELYQAAAPGEWLATAGVVYAVLHDEESRVANCDFGNRDDVATARFIAHVHEAFPVLLDAVEQRDQLWKALMIISESSGDFTQNVVNDALYAVGYYIPEEDN